MNTRDIQAFVAVVETGSIVAASTRLHMTQSGITRRIQSLEGMLGVTLLDRVSKPLKPTAAGRDVYTLGRKVLRSIDDLVTGVGPGSEPNGEFRLGVPVFLSELMLADPVDRLRAAYPKLSLKITSGWSPTMLKQLQTNAIDAAILVVPEDAAVPDNLAAHVLCRYDTVIVASRTGDFPQGDLPLGALATHAWVLNQDGCGLRRAIARSLDVAGLPFEVAVEASGTELQLSLVSRGVGVGIVTRASLERSPLRDAVRVLSIPGFHTGVSVWLVHAQETGRLTRPLDTLRSALAKVLG